MADFCNVCALKMWGLDIPPDIDVYEILEEVETGYARAVLCEGCGMSWVGKDDDGTPVLHFDYNDKAEDRKYTLEEWESGALTDF